MIAYLDLPSGISGDMLLGCLVDGGWPLEALRATVEQLRLPAGSCQVAAETVMRGPLRATLVSVSVVEGDRHRHLGDICELIAASGLPAAVQARASAVFTRLAQAEAAVHGTTVEEVHFHEVGALDAIVDITGACMGLHELGVTQLYASSVPLGEGWAVTQHGRLPLPAPATLALLAGVQAPTRPAPGAGRAGHADRGGAAGRAGRIPAAVHAAAADRARHGPEGLCLAQCGAAVVGRAAGERQPGAD